MSGFKFYTLIKYVLYLEPLKGTISMYGTRSQQNQYFDNMSTCIIGRLEKNLYANCKFLENLFTRSLRVTYVYNMMLPVPGACTAPLLAIQLKVPPAFEGRYFSLVGASLLHYVYVGFVFCVLWLLFSLVFLSVCTIIMFFDHFIVIGNVIIVLMQSRMAADYQ